MRRLREALSGASADGACTNAPSTAAGSPVCTGAFLCSGTAAACPTACTTDAGCPTGDYCAANGTCQPQKAAGASCNVAAGADCKTAACRECTTGNCTDGVCCGSASCTACDSCSAALQAPGGTAGTCSPSRVLTDPHGDCTTGSMTCNGKGACGLGATGRRRRTRRRARAASRRTESAATRRAATHATFARRRSAPPPTGLGRLRRTAWSAPRRAAAASSATGRARFRPSAACTTDAQCIAGDYCASSGTCQPQKAQGGSCNLAAGADCEVAGCRECATGNCVDGVCCGALRAGRPGCAANLQAPGASTGVRPVDDRHRPPRRVRDDERRATAPGRARSRTDKRRAPQRRARAARPPTGSAATPHAINRATCARRRWAPPSTAPAAWRPSAMPGVPRAAAVSPATGPPMLARRPAARPTPTAWRPTSAAPTAPASPRRPKAASVIPPTAPPPVVASAPRATAPTACAARRNRVRFARPARLRCKPAAASRGPARLRSTAPIPTTIAPSTRLIR